MRRPAPTCTVDEILNKVTTRMNREHLRHFVVLDGQRIAGILSVGDLLKRRIEELEVETGVLRDYVVAQRARGRASALLGTAAVRCRRLVQGA